MNNRRFIIQAIFIFTGIVFLSRLFAIQVLDPTYKLAAEDNVKHRIIQYPFRGIIYDRNNKEVVVNEPIYDLMIIPKEAVVKDTVKFCELFNITKKEFDAKANKARGYRPSTFIKQISNREFASIQNALIDYPGFFIESRTVRKYPNHIMSNALGYIGEISKKKLEKDKSGYYKQGDYIGISGLEASYEKHLRGKRGVKHMMVDVKGVEKGSYRNGNYDTLAVPGGNLISTIDIKLQRYAETLLKGKIGSVVAIEPSSGEVLAIVSSPTYDPNMLTGRNFGKNFNILQKDTLFPLYNRPIMAIYPPGSIFKSVQALIALQEGIISKNQQIFCQVNENVIGDHAPSGYYDVVKGIKYSSNTFFYKIFKKMIQQGVKESIFEDSRIGFEKWNNYVSKFCLGSPTQIDLPNEKSGAIPSVEYYDKIYGEKRWAFSTIYSLSIGQGEMLVTPIQMANLAAIIANRGYYYYPHLIKNDGNGTQKKYKEKHNLDIDSEHFNTVIEGMAQAIYGTAQRAIIKDIEVCGKTGTAENPHGEDHSVFMAFAPRKNPKIAISVYVENAGWGGRAAASTASLIIEKYLNDCIERQYLEDFVLKGDFIY